VCIHILTVCFQQPVHHAPLSVTQSANAKQLQLLFFFLLLTDILQNIQQKKLKHDFETHIHSKRLHDSVENLTQKEQAG
jgi:hypothetical protein